MPNKFNFDKVIARFERQKRDLPKKLGNQAVIFFQSNFQRQGFLDKTREAWKKRKNDKDAGRAVLIKTGALRRDIKLRSANFYKIVISTSLPYAAIHNYGGTINKQARTGTISFRKGKGGKLRIGKTRTEKQRGKIVAMSRHSIGSHIVKMPQRKFMGNSAYLNKQLLTIIKQDMDKIFK